MKKRSLIGYLLATMVASNAQAGRGLNAPGSNAPGSNGPGSNAPGSNGPGSNAPGSNAPGSNGPGSNGPGSNGPGSNGPGSNGPGSNGPGSNAPGSNAPGSNAPGSNSNRAGFSLTGPNFATTDGQAGWVQATIGGVPVTNARVNWAGGSSALEVSTNNGATWISGAAVGGTVPPVGATPAQQEAAWDSGLHYCERLDDYNAATSVEPCVPMRIVRALQYTLDNTMLPPNNVNNDVWTYRVQKQVAVQLAGQTSPTLQWVNLCSSSPYELANAEDANNFGLFLSGYFDNQVDYHDDASRQTFACGQGTAAKAAYVFGYKPWKASLAITNPFGISRTYSSKEVYVTVVNALMNNYCHTGVGQTLLGTSIDVTDVSGRNTYTPETAGSEYGFTTEASWYAPNAQSGSGVMSGLTANILSERFRDVDFGDDCGFFGSVMNRKTLDHAGFNGIGSPHAPLNTGYISTFDLAMNGRKIPYSATLDYNERPIVQMHSAPACLHKPSDAGASLDPYCNECTMAVCDTDFTTPGFQLPTGDLAGCCVLSTKDSGSGFVQTVNPTGWNGFCQAYAAKVCGGLGSGPTPIGWTGATAAMLDGFTAGPTISAADATNDAPVRTHPATFSSISVLEDTPSVVVFPYTPTVDDRLGYTPGPVGTELDQHMWFRITNVVGGTLFYGDGVTQMYPPIFAAGTPQDQTYTWKEWLQGAVFKPAANFSGTASIEWVVEDNGKTNGVIYSPNFRSLSQSRTITITPVNDVPTVSGFPKGTVTISEDSPQSIALTNVGVGGGADEAVSQTLSLSVTSSNTALIPNPTVSGSGSTRTVSFTPVANKNGGPVTLTLTANDGAGGVTTRTVDYQITPVNDAPIGNIASPSNCSAITTNYSSACVPTFAVSSPADETPETYTYTFVAQPASCVKVYKAGQTTQAAAGNMTSTEIRGLRVKSSASGAACATTFTVRVTDNNGGILNHVVNANVSGVN